MKIQRYYKLSPKSMTRGTLELACYSIKLDINTFINKIKIELVPMLHLSAITKLCCEIFNKN